MAECVSGFRIEAEWDEDKDRVNLAKHGVDFETAASVFYDPLAMTAYDPVHSVEEERWNTVGSARNGSVLFVSTQSPMLSRMWFRSGSFRPARLRRPNSASTRRTHDQRKTR